MLMGRICGSFIHVKVLVNGEVLCLGLLTICDTQSMLSFGILVLLIFFIWVHCSCLQTHTSRVCIRSHYRWLWSTMWLLGIELRTYVRAVSALNLWVISPAPWFSYIPWTSWFHLSTLYLVPLHGGLSGTSAWLIIWYLCMVDWLLVSLQHPKLMMNKQRRCLASHNAMEEVSLHLWVC